MQKNVACWVFCVLFSAMSCFRAFSRECCALFALLGETSRLIACCAVCALELPACCDDAELRAETSLGEVCRVLFEKHTGFMDVCNLRYRAPQPNPYLHQHCQCISQCISGTRGRACARAVVETLPSLQLSGLSVRLGRAHALDSEGQNFTQYAGIRPATCR